MDDWYLKPYDRRLEVKTPVSKVGTYDSPDGLISATVVLQCETEETGESVVFQNLIRSLTRHVAEHKPTYVCFSDIPAPVLSSHVEIRRQRHIQEGKPLKIAERLAINETRRHLFGLCLMEQETEMGRVEDLIKDVIARTGEFIRVGEFQRT